MMRKFNFLLFISLVFCARTQDTLFLKNGEVKVVQINKIDNTNELLFYTANSKLYVRDINSIDRYTQSEQVENNQFQSNINLAEGSFMDAQRTARNVRDLTMKYAYNKFSVGFNLLFPISLIGMSRIAYNPNISFYGQYDFNETRGIRLPVRIGFNALKGESTTYPYIRDSYNHRDLHYEFGVEYIENTAENILKKHGYHVVGVYLGAVSNVKSNYLLDPWTEIYTASSPRGYYRVSYNYGIQFNFSRTFQLNVEAGLNVNTMKRDRLTLGLQGAVHLVHRFGGKVLED